MGTRHFDKPDGYTDFFTQLIDCDGELAYNTPGSRVTSVRRGLKSGASTPGYHKIVEKGGMLPLNAYRRWDYQGDVSLGTLIHTDTCSGGRTSVYTYTGYGPGLRLWDGASLTGDVSVLDPWDRVNTDALIIAAMADILPDLDALTTAVEAKKTFQMVRDVRRDAKDLIRSALRGGKHTVKAASDAWLAWRYGWQQLGRDISNVHDFLVTPLSTIVVSGQSGQSFTEAMTETSTSSWTNVDHLYTYNFSYDTSVRARVLAKYKVDTLNALADPAISFWESIPYSFVADWFVNVGDVLAAWKVRTSVDSIYASLGWKQTVRVQGTREASANATGTVTGVGTSSETFSSKGRIPTSIPSLVPSIDVNLNSTRITDLAALCAKRIL